ncbi:MAG: hypothetical protein ACT4P6_19370 [Gemmatimonadaceae bacterium]
MTRHRFAASLVAAVSATLLAGCALIQPPLVPAVPALRTAPLWRPACSAAIARAHSALSTVGEDPAAAHAAHAIAMHEYHVCLTAEQ